MRITDAGPLLEVLADKWLSVFDIGRLMWLKALKQTNKSNSSKNSIYFTQAEQYNEILNFSV